jgi:tRNA/rRNA methyltransferase
MPDKKENLPVFILVRPQMGENIGAVARAMGNFCISEMRIVAPRDGWPNESALATASGAFDHINPPRVYDDLASALADIQYAYGTTARERDLAKPVLLPATAAEDSARRSLAAQPSIKTAFVFGPERTGLENDDIALCHALVRVPTNPAFSSLNLGQCALLMAYEAARAFGSGAAPVANPHIPAAMEEFETLWKRLETALDEAGFFTEDNLKPKVVRNIKTMMLRGEPSSQELRTYHGILSALLRQK